MQALLIILTNNINKESIVIAVAGYLIVFAALVLLFWFFSTVPKLIVLLKSRKQSGKGNTSELNEMEAISGESTAAIAMALHLYLNEIHDDESGVLTIKRISRNYSPWSSKIYAVRNQFNRL